MTSHTSDDTDQSSSAPAEAVTGRSWRPAGVAFLLVSLLGLSAGAFVEFFLPAHRISALPSPPALQVLLSAQAVFLVMFWPLLSAKRGFIRTGKFLASAVIEYIIYLAVCAPLYTVAAVLSDATATDVIRCLLYLTAVASLTWGLGLWAGTGRAAIITAVTLAGALVGLGGPVVCYLLAELTDAAGAAGRLFSAAPATCAFNVAAGGANWYPAPIWAWALWPAVGAVLAFAFLLAGPNMRRRA